MSSPWEKPDLPMCLDDKATHSSCRVTVTALQSGKGCNYNRSEGQAEVRTQMP